MRADDPAMDVPAHVLDYLRAQHTLTLATVSSAGLPHAATYLYVNDDLALYFWVWPDTATAHHIDDNPSVSFTIDAYSPDWTKTKGIQGSGEAKVLLNSGEIRRVVGMFKEKFPELSTARTANLSFFRITPAQLHYIDNERRDATDEQQALGIDYHRSMVYSVFRDMPRQDAETLAAKLETVRVDGGETIVRQGAPADKFFIIVDGEVEVVRETDGQERQVASLRAGQFFGEVAILRDRPRNATVRALVPTTLLTMDRDMFRGLVAQSLSTTRDFNQIIQERMEELAVPHAAGTDTG